MKRMLKHIAFIFPLFLFPFAPSFVFIAHTQTPSATRGVIRLKVKYKTGEVTKELPRKRFFLIKGSLEENKGLIDRIKQPSVPSRACYYRSKGASDAFIKWLKENDCESVFCREIEEKYISGDAAVPEFQAAYKEGLREFKTGDIARRWLPVNLPAEIRDGFYNEKQKLINALIAQAEATTKTRVWSVMTDRKGTAYLTDIDPGIYTISNLVGSETDQSSIVWVCEKEVKAVDLSTAMRRPLMLSNEKDPKVKCEVVERPLPNCEQTVK